MPGLSRQKGKRIIMKVKLFCSLVGLVLWGAPLAAQEAPGTDIFLVSVRMSEGQLKVGHAVNITDRKGYDNQPSFLSDGWSLLYTSMRGGQSDIYRYSIRDRSTQQVTDTPNESEYSPTIVPGGDAFSVIRVEADSTQRLCLKISNPSAITPGSMITCSHCSCWGIQPHFRSPMPAVVRRKSSPTTSVDHCTRFRASTASALPTGCRTTGSRNSIRRPGVSVLLSGCLTGMSSMLGCLTARR